ncbi:beta-galactosidase [Loktanella sp. F6476L]|uniref:beta-galactosidase n=1 Tax=Loktanella sp. F6476L TaxID=2926405 RepID=UPI001FF54859|nr:beta-galactosidase [Loktanella sp. F6476L]MCK0120477.1 beta-galactosidase [Loktanella sp. F6476L]
MNRTLGVCYYPEHWPEERWETDAAQMVANGLTWVRIGEFAWSLMEPTPGTYDWGWLDRAIDVLGKAGLKVVLGTPSATPPRWMIDKHPDMLAVDANNQTRKFGSRRHYDFSHLGFRAEAVRIARLMAERYGKNPYIAAWQIDNEYDCHDTTLSYSEAAKKGFQDWLAQRYQSTDALNRAWGNVFWSMQYDTFDQIELPNLTVTEPNHPHQLAFRRYSSDQVVAFNKAQVDVIRPHTDAPLIHNYMGRITTFDHWKVGADLDIASWDSYPIGFLSDRIEGTPKEKQTYLRQGHPDNQAFHHDLYRAVGRGRMWVMEQQPGPVNWAPYNPAPLPGMARLWAWEAFAHGAETVCYFRWRQAPFAQEQMHAALLRPDAEPAPALAEAAQVAEEIAQLPDVGTAASPVALVFDYESAWAWDVQPQGADFDMFRLAFAAYRGLRRAGLSVDIIHPETADLSAYKLVLAPGLMTLSDPFRAALDTFDGIALIGPRTDTKTDELAIPTPLGPNLPNTDVSVVMAESLPPSDAIKLQNGGKFLHWFDHLEGDADVYLSTKAGQPAIMGSDNVRYLAGWPSDDTFDQIIGNLCDTLEIATFDLPKGLRIRDTATHRFVFNYAPKARKWGDVIIPAAGVHWEEI